MDTARKEAMNKAEGIVSKRIEADFEGRTTQVRAQNVYNTLKSKQKKPPGSEDPPTTSMAATTTTTTLTSIAIPAVDTVDLGQE